MSLPDNLIFAIKIIKIVTPLSTYGINWSVFSAVKMNIACHDNNCLLRTANIICKKNVQKMVPILLLGAR